DVCSSDLALRSHSEAVWIETEKPLGIEQVQAALAAAPGVVLQDDPASKTYPMPLFTGGKDDIYVGRVRKDLANDNGITLWLSGDQIKKGAALNAVQIAEFLLSRQ
ncbi:MAG: aspartate-semialdehyde dehydrogenase, partial [Bacteroidales bacterium]|nr:aspartate-semialdehyde dehydrogenase [Bacteroidales bacterium]